MRLTAKERILLHLLECGRSAEEAEVSQDLAQEGVARGAGIELRHLAQFIHPLIEEDLVRERRAHVTGIRQRRKVYSLTPSGRVLAIRLREKVTTQKVRIRDGDAVREGSLHEILRNGETKATLLETIRQVEQAGVVDLERVRHPPEAGLVEQLGDAPQIKTFVGRQAELAELTQEGEGPRVFVIRGMAGIGKSTLAAKACSLVRGRRNLFWHRVRPWESDAMVLANLGRFLEALDRPGLSSVLRRGEARLAGEVLRQDLPDTRSFLVIDDAHDASPPTLAVIRMIAEAVAAAPDVRLLVLTRRTLPFYDVRDIVVKGLVREFELGGLRPEEAASLLTEEGNEADLLGLGRRLAGHPLLIELVRKQRSDIPGAIRDVHRFVEETVYRELTDPERTTMKAASLYRVPVPRTSLLAIPGATYEALAALQERSLLRFVGEERYEVHDTVRDFFSSVLVPEETRRFGALAIGELRALADRSSAAGDFVGAIDCLSNAVRLSVDPTEKAQILESLGDAEARLGDFPAILVAYREAIGLITAPESLARLHRKMASEFQERSEVPSAVAEIDEALRALADRENVERGWLELVRSRVSNGLESWVEASAHGATALQVFRSFGDDRGQAEALVELATAETNSPLGRSDAACGFLEDALRIGRKIDDPALLASVHVQWANLQAYRLGDTAKAFEHLDAVDALPGAVEDVRSRELLLLLKGWLNLDLRADFEAAQMDFDALRILATKMHDRATAALARYGAAVAVYHAGDCAAARSELEAVGEELLALGSAGPAVEAFHMAAEICLVVGDLEGNRAISARMKAPALEAGRAARPVLANALEGIDCLARGDREGVHAAFQRAIEDAERGASPQQRPMIPYAHDLYGAALEALGEDEKSAAEIRLAVELSERFGLNGRIVARAKFMDGLHGSLRRLFPSVAPPENGLREESRTTARERVNR